MCPNICLQFMHRVFGVPVRWVRFGLGVEFLNFEIGLRTCVFNYLFSLLEFPFGELFKPGDVRSIYICMFAIWRRCCCCCRCCLNCRFGFPMFMCKICRTILYFSRFWNHKHVSLLCVLSFNTWGIGIALDTELLCSYVFVWVFVNCHMFDLNSRFAFCHVIFFRKQMFLCVAQHQTVGIWKCVLAGYKHLLTTFNQAMSCSSIFTKLSIFYVIPNGWYVCAHITT